MTIQDVRHLPLIEFGIMILMLAYAIQVLRGKSLLSGGLLALLTANKSRFDEATDPAILFLAKTAHKTPDEVQRSVEWLWLLTTGQPLHPQDRAALAESTAQKQLKDIIPDAAKLPPLSPMGDFWQFRSPNVAITGSSPSNITVTSPENDANKRLPEEDPDAAG